MGIWGMSNQATAQSPSFGATIDRPACPYCGERVYLTRRTPHPDYDLCYERQIFTCSACDQTIERLVDANGNTVEHPHRVDCLDYARLQMLRRYRAGRRAALSFLRGVTSNLRAASLHFEPECFCSCHSSRGSARHIMALVTTRSALPLSDAPHSSRQCPRPVSSPTHKLHRDWFSLPGLRSNRLRPCAEWQSTNNTQKTVALWLRR